MEEVALPALPNWKTGLKMVAAFAALILLTYGPSITNEFAPLDDGLLIYENNALKEISTHTLKTIFTSYDPELYIPLTLFSYQIDYLIAGYNPVIYHITNLILHTLNALLVFLFTFLITRKKWLALFCGVFFAIHPIQTETVAWAAARKDLLSTFFFLVTMVSYLYYRGNSARQKQWYGVSIIAFLMGLLAKVTIAPLPIILLALDLYQKRKKDMQMLLDKVPYFLLSIAFGLIALGGKTDLLDDTTLFQKALLGAKSTVFYLWKFIAPLRLSVFHPQLSAIELTNPEIFVPLLILIGIVIALWNTRKSQPLFLFAAVFSLLMLAPSFSTISKGGNIFFASERYFYISSIGVLLIFGSLVLKLFAQNTKRVTAALVIVVALFVTMTGTQARRWGDGVALFAQSTEMYPEFYLPHISLGASLRRAKKTDEAIAEYEKALSLQPLPNTYGLIGQVYAERGDYNRAVEEFERGLALDPADLELLYGLGQVYGLMGEIIPAIDAYERSLAAMPVGHTDYQKLSRRIATRRDKVYYRMGLLYGERGSHEQSVEYQRKAIEENPYFADAHYNLAVGLGQMQKMAEAITHYELAVQNDPGHIHARVNLGILYHRNNRTDDAKKQFEHVLKYDPFNTTAKRALQQIR